jgi:23S rRNA pseudouridine955/2504/2580 synthase
VTEKQGVKTVVVTGDLAGRRADAALAALIPEVGRKAAKEHFRLRCVRLNGSLIQASARVQAGDSLSIPAEPLAEPPTARENSFSRRGPKLFTPHGLQIVRLFEDEHVLAVSKPAGVEVGGGDDEVEEEPGRRDNLIEVFLRAYPPHGLFPAHRLDRQTSGCLVFAKTRPALAALTKAFAARLVKKEYLLTVRGVPQWERQTMSRAMRLIVRGEKDYEADSSQARRALARGRQPVVGKRYFEAVRRAVVLSPGTHSADALAAETEFVVAERFVGFSLLLCHPLTGRMHQIRAHAAALGFPPALDSLYGRQRALRLPDIAPLNLLPLLRKTEEKTAPSRKAAAAKARKTRNSAQPSPQKHPVANDSYLEWDDAEEMEREKPILSRVPLHAAKLTFPHPLTGADICVEAPLPSDLRLFLALLRKIKELRENVESGAISGW